MAVKFKASAILSLLSKILRSEPKPSKPLHEDSTIKGTPLECQKSSRLIQLPEDVIFVIAEHLSTADKARLLRTCRYFHSLLEATQYYHLHVANPWLYHKSNRLFRTLVERPDLVPRIISYRGPLAPGVISPRPPPKSNHLRLRLRKPKPSAPYLDDGLPMTGPESIQRAISIFTAAVNVRELEFTDHTAWVTDPIWEPVRETISKTALTRLALLTTTESAEVVPLLRAQPELEHLELSWMSSKLEDLKETDIPKLKSLRGTLLDAAAIVPGRPVEEFFHLFGTGDYVLEEHLVQRLSLSSRSITKFNTRLHDPRAPDLVRNAFQIFARHLPELQYLTITVGGDISGEMLLEEIPEFKSLRGLKLLYADLLDTNNPSRGSSRTSMAVYLNETSEIVPQIPIVNGWEVLTQKLRARCPSLVSIEHTPRPFCCCGLGF